MKVLLLAAGYGTRLYPITKNVPKSLLPVKGKPVLEHVIERLKNHEIIDGIYIVTNNKFFNSFSEWKDKLNVNLKNMISIINDNTHSEDDKLGAVGDIDYVLKHENIKDSLLIILGDNLFEFELDGFLKYSDGDNMYPKVAVVDFLNRKSDVSKYGVVKLNDDNQIVNFQEKPEYPDSTLVAIGLYLFPSKSLKLISEYLDGGNNSDNIGYLIKWLSENYKVYAHKFPCKWHDIGSIEEYRKVTEDRKQMTEDRKQKTENR